MPSDDPTQLSMLFHLNSEPWLNDEAYRAEPYHQEFKRLEPVMARHALPQPTASDLETSALMAAITERRSHRDFPIRQLSQSALSMLLSAAYGCVEIAAIPGAGQFLRRSVPSGGGLYPLEIYLFVQRVDGLSDGLYHYDVISHALDQLSDAWPADELQSAFYTYPYFANANLVFCHAAIFTRTQKKYGPRGYRYVLLEAGHSAQNICLAATTLGLGSLCMGGFVDTLLNRLLKLAPQEGAIYGVAVG